MYNRIFKFFNDNNSIYPLQFGFRQKFSTTHALISLTEDIRKNLDEGNIGCDIFVDLQEAFYTVEHNILLAKLEHYGIRGLADEWFRSYLSNRKQYVSINGKSCLCFICCTTRFSPWSTSVFNLHQWP